MVSDDKYRQDHIFIIKSTDVGFLVVGWVQKIKSKKQTDNFKKLKISGFKDAEFI